MLDFDETISFGLELERSSGFTEPVKTTISHKKLSGRPRFGGSLSKDAFRLNFIKRELIHNNFSKSTEDLENLSDYFKSKLKKDPFDVDSTLSLGNCFRKLGYVSRAKRLYSLFNKKKQNFETIFIELANIFYDEKNYKKAKYYYEQALNSKRVSLWEPINEKLAFCCYNLKDFKLGASFADLALKQAKFNSIPEIHLLFGNLYLGNKQYHKAIRQYKRGLVNLQSYSKAIKNIVLSSTTNNKIDPKSFSEAIKLTSPKILEAKILNNLGNALNKLGDYISAKHYLESALSLSNLPHAQNNLALTLKSLGDLDGALIHLSKAYQTIPDSALINHNLAETYLAKGNELKAIEHFKKTLTYEKANKFAAFKLNALLGKNIISAPDSYVSNLFDRYSETFENHLLSSLAYKVPKEISRYISSTYGKTFKLDRVIDLGCGTGLCSITLKGNCSELIGIDLSQQMLIKAKEKSLYTQLEQKELTKYLKSSKLKCDLIIAGDVLIYVGKLDDLLYYSNQTSKKGGRFIFSIELSNTGDFKINKTGRFSHSKSYITKLAHKYNWHIDYEKEIELRKEHNKTVKGVLFALLKR